MSGTRRPAPITAQGSKNCFNHLIPAAFAAGPEFSLVIHNTPAITDRDVVRRMLAETGVHTRLTGTELIIHSGPKLPVIPAALGARLRVTICYAAAMAANLGTAHCPLPGGDAFTSRPIDVHVRVLEAAGARCEIRRRTMSVHFAHPPRPISVDVGTAFGPSMGASATALVVAALATGTSTVTGLSIEPEILGLISVLRQLGVGIVFEDTHAVRVDGAGGPLRGHAAATVSPDRMEAGTYLLTGLLLHERVTVEGIRPGDFPEGFTSALDTAGVELTGRHDATTATRHALRPVDVVTTPHPGFPTDLQPQMAAFLTQAEGRSSVTETVYRSRITHVTELAKLGIDIPVIGGRQEIHGRQQPRGGGTAVADIRCGAAVLIAAAAARQPVRLADPAGHLARGYGDLAAKLGSLGMELKPATENIRTVA